MFLQEKALQVVKSMGDDNVLQQIISEGLMGLKKRTGTKKMDKHINRDKNKENDQSQMRNINSESKSYCQPIFSSIKSLEIRNVNFQISHRQFCHFYFIFLLFTYHQKYHIM